MAEQPHEADVELTPMSAQEYDAWRADAVESFAADIAEATGRPLDAARARAAGQFEQLLPEGQNTADTWLLSIINDSGDRVGYLWLGPHGERAGVGFVYDLWIAEEHRQRGYGRAAMLAGETILRNAGLAEVGLNVFGFNSGAQRLYESIGYRVVATQMTKRLD